MAATKQSETTDVPSIGRKTKTATDATTATNSCLRKDFRNSGEILTNSPVVWRAEYSRIVNSMDNNVSVTRIERMIKSIEN